MRTLNGVLVLGAANGQLIPGFGILPASIQNTVLNTVKNTVQSATGIDTTAFVSDEALISILSDPKTTDPMSWDEEFLTPLVENVENGAELIAYTQMAQGIAEEGAVALAAVGITSPADLNSATMAQALGVIVESDPAFEQVLMDTFNADGSFDSIDDVLSDLTAGFDDVVENYADELADPTQWDAIMLSNIMTQFVESSTIAGDYISADMITQAADYAEQGLTMADEAGLADLNSDNLLADLMAPLEVCTGTLDAARTLGIQTLRGILDFDAAKFMESLAKLIGDGAQCYEAYKSLTADGATEETIVDQVLEYAPYPFMAIEKYYKLSDSYETIQVDYRHLVIDINALFYVYAPLMETSYVQYGRSVSRGISDNIWPKVGQFVEEGRMLYNTVLEDIPVLENYQLNQVILKQYLNVAHNHWGYVVDGFQALDKMGIDQIEQMVRKSKKTPSTTPATKPKPDQTKPNGATESTDTPTDTKPNFWQRVNGAIQLNQEKSKQWWQNLVNRVRN